MALHTLTSSRWLAVVINSKGTRHYEFETTVNVFKVIFLASTSSKSFDKRCKQGLNVGFSKKKSTVPNSVYTVIPQAANESTTNQPPDEGYSNTSNILFPDNLILPA